MRVRACIFAACFRVCRLQEQWPSNQNLPWTLKLPSPKWFGLREAMRRRISTDVARFGLALCNFIKIQSVSCAENIEALNIRVTKWAIRVGGFVENYTNVGTLCAEGTHTHRNCKKKNWACNHSFDTNTSFIFLPLIKIEVLYSFLVPYADNNTLYSSSWSAK